MQAVPHDVLYSSMVWKFTVNTAGAAGPQHLPYHRFRQGDSLLISQHLEQQVGMSVFEGMRQYMLHMHCHLSSVQMTKV